MEKSNKRDKSGKRSSSKTDKADKKESASKSLSDIKKRAKITSHTVDNVSSATFLLINIISRLQLSSTPRH